MADLAAYLRRAAQPREWGIVPCAIFAADWVVECGHPDPLAFMRDDDDQAALRRLVKAGGVAGLARQGMAPLILPEPDEPRAGDVGVIERPTADSQQQACAIFGGERWVTLGMCGIEAGPGRVLAIWRP